MTILLAKVLFVIYSFIAVFLSVILLFFSRSFKKTGQRRSQKLANLAIFVLLAPIITLLIALPYSHFIEPNWVEVKKITIRSDKFPDDFSRLKIIQLSDFHMDKIGLREKKVISVVKKVRPDLIFITGDFVTYRKNLPICLEFLRQLKAKFGIYAVLGNHDYYQFHESELIPKLLKAGVYVLKHDNLELNLGLEKKIWIVGLSDHYGGLARYGQPHFLRDAFTLIPLKDIKIFLTHNPDVAALPDLKEFMPDLILAGHTHGGQFGIDMLRRYSWYAERSEFMAGLYKVNGMQLYVNKGIGTITKPVRFLARPEITIIQLKNK